MPMYDGIPIRRFEVELKVLASEIVLLSARTITLRRETIRSRSEIAYPFLKMAFVVCEKTNIGHVRGICTRKNRTVD